MNTLGQQINQLFATRMRAMHAHAKMLNIFLEMRIVALRGKADFQESIKYIADRLPSCHSGDTEGDRAFSFLVGQAFTSLVSEFESFLVDVMSLVARSYPNKLGTETFRLSEILELRDPELVVRVATERFINSVMYKRPSEYRKALGDVLSADTNFLATGVGVAPFERTQYVLFKGEVK